MQAARHTLVVPSARTEDTQRLGTRLGLALRAAEVDSFFVDLRGDLGAGKTVFARGLAAGLGVAAREVVSPTFTIARSYALDDGVLDTLHHIDAYRLRSPEELDAAGFEDMCGTGRVTCVEWGEHVEDALPMDRLSVELLRRLPAGPAPRFDDPETPREIRLEARGSNSTRVLALVRSGARAPGARG